MRSDRFYWCTGCGRWHDPCKGQSTHYAMYCSYQEPNERNFEGTAEELKRFLAAIQLRREDEAAFEKRVDETLRS